jgi:SHS2 domain-containing protein
MEAASEAFTASVTPLDTVQPRQAEELDVDAPDLDLLLVDFLSELLYRFDARGWLTRFAEIEVHEKDGGWTLEGTLRGERHDPAPSPRAPIAAIGYEGLQVLSHDDHWTATVTFRRKA